MAIGHPHHRNALPFYSEHVVGKPLVGTTEKEMAAGVTSLKNRKALVIVNDSSGLLYLSNQPTFNISEGAIIVFSGEAIQFDFDPEIETKIFGKTTELTLEIRCLEVK